MKPCQNPKAPICPVCGKDLVQDGVTRWQCAHSLDSYAESEYIIRPGEVPVRRKGGSDHETLPKP